MAVSILDLLQINFSSSRSIITPMFFVLSCIFAGSFVRWLKKFASILVRK